MSEPKHADLAADHDDVGLCASCRHVRVVRSDKGSRFYMCLLSKTNPQFPKYPHLPVLRCSGYQPTTEDAG